LFSPCPLCPPCEPCFSRHIQKRIAPSQKEEALTPRCSRALSRSNQRADFGSPRSLAIRPLSFFLLRGKHAELKFGVPRETSRLEVGARELSSIFSPCPLCPPCEPCFIFRTCHWCSHFSTPRYYTHSNNRERAEVVIQ